MLQLSGKVAICLYKQQCVFVCEWLLSAICSAAWGARRFFSSLSLNFIYFASPPVLLSLLCTKAANLHNVTQWQWRGPWRWQSVCRTDWKVCRQIQFCFPSQLILISVSFLSLDSSSALLFLCSSSLSLSIQFTALHCHECDKSCQTTYTHLSPAKRIEYILYINTCPMIVCVCVCVLHIQLPTPLFVTLSHSHLHSLQLVSCSHFWVTPFKR